MYICTRDRIDAKSMVPELYTAWYALSIFCTFLGATVTCIGYTVLRYGHGNILCIYDFESVNDYNKHFQWRRAGRLIILCGLVSARCCFVYGDRGSA